MSKEIGNVQEQKAPMRLKLLRIEKGYTQAMMAEKLNVSQQTYSNIEKGESRLDVNLIKQICALFQVSADYLLGLDDHKESASVVKKRSEMNFMEIYAMKNKIGD